MRDIPVAVCGVLVLIACGDDGGASSTPRSDAAGADSAREDAGADTDDVGDNSDAGGPADPRVEVDTTATIAQTAPGYLSFSIDTAQVVGGFFWDPEGVGGGGTTGTARVDPFPFDNPRVRAFAQHLAPAYLRIGGTDADFVYYDWSDTPAEEPPEPYREVMTRAQFDGFGQFALDMGFDILFTLNAGPGPRDDQLVWQTDQARTVMQHSVAMGYPVRVWELGNEVNGYRAVHAIGVDAPAYSRDFGALQTLIDELDPSARAAGPSPIFWAGGVGEIYPILGDFLAESGDNVPVATWHWYPQQSRRCGVQPLAAGPEVLLDPVQLDEVGIYARDVTAFRDTHSPSTEVWMGETGNAQCGGEIDVSDSFSGSFWWADILGQLAVLDHKVVVRQTLSGSNYGMLDDVTYEPRPDFWLSVLWKRLMGPRVLSAVAVELPATLRAYAHCHPDEPRATLLLINLDNAELNVSLAEGLPTMRYTLTAQSLASKTVMLNGAELMPGQNDELPELAGEVVTDESLDLPARSITFVTLGVDAPACQ